MSGSYPGTRRCSLCGINYPTHVGTCRKCGGKTDYVSNGVPDDDWVEASGGGVEQPSRGEVSFIYETGPDGVERIFITTADLVRARLATSAMALRVMASDYAQGPHFGLPLLEVNGLLVELQGLDRVKRRWWVELLESPVPPDTPVSF